MTNFSHIFIRVPATRMKGDKYEALINISTIALVTPQTSSRMKGCIINTTACPDYPVFCELEVEDVASIITMAGASVTS